MIRYTLAVTVCVRAPSLWRHLVAYVGNVYVKDFVIALGFFFNG